MENINFWKSLDYQYNYDDLILLNYIMVTSSELYYCFKLPWYKMQTFEVLIDKMFFFWMKIDWSRIKLKYVQGFKKKISRQSKQIRWFFLLGKSKCMWTLKKSISESQLETHHCLNMDLVFQLHFQKHTNKWRKEHKRLQFDMDTKICF